MKKTILSDDVAESIDRGAVVSISMSVVEESYQNWSNLSEAINKIVGALTLFGTKPSDCRQTYF